MSAKTLESSEIVLAQRIETIAIEALKPVESNPRHHSTSNVQKIAESIRLYGWTTPVLVTDELEVIAGHGRILGAKKLGLTEVPCIKLSHLTPQLVEAYRIADNRLALDSEWDDELLTAAIQRLAADPDFDLTSTGFNSDEIDDFLQYRGGGGSAGEDDQPEQDMGGPTVSALGDIWELGRHRVICGDCTVITDVQKLLNGQEPNLMVTDPPYGVEYDPKWREEYDQFERHAVGKVENDDRADWQDAWALFHGSIAYVWHGGLHSSVVLASLEACGFKARAQIIWAKQHFVFSRGDYHWQHEPCWYVVKNTGNWTGDRSQSTVWEIKNLNPMGGNQDEQVVGHGTQKPVECMRRPLLNHTERGDSVYDPFLGSGTTLIAAETTGRVAYGCEINPAYVDMAVRRWEAFTGQRARLSGDGRTFEEVAGCRPNEQVA